MYELRIRTKEDDDMYFIEFETFDIVLDFIRIFEKHSNTICKYLISFNN